MQVSKWIEMIQSHSPERVFVLFGCAVTWKSSKHEMVAGSTCESKYIFASEASKEST